MIDIIVSYHLSLRHDLDGGVHATRLQVVMLETIPGGLDFVKGKNDNCFTNQTNLVRSTIVASTTPVIKRAMRR